MEYKITIMSAHHKIFLFFHGFYKKAKNKTGKAFYRSFTCYYIIKGIRTLFCLTKTYFTITFLP